MLRARERGIPVNVVHNASIINAVGCTGLQLYNFGPIVSVCLWSDTFRPSSYARKISENVSRKQHTLCLLGAFVHLVHNLDIVSQTSK